MGRQSQAARKRLRNVARATCRRQKQRSWSSTKSTHAAPVSSENDSPGYTTPSRNRDAVMDNAMACTKAGALAATDHCVKPR